MGAYPEHSPIVEFYFSALSLFAHRYGYRMWMDEEKVNFEGLVEHSSNPAYIELMGIEESWNKLAHLYMMYAGKG